MRLLRLLVACVVFFVARPANAMPSVDRIVLVAERAPTASVARPDRTPPSRKVARSIAATLQPLASAPARIRREDVRDAPVVLVPRKYLRHCALLC